MSRRSGPGQYRTADAEPARGTRLEEAMTTTTGRPLDDQGEPTDGPSLELDPTGPAAQLLRESPRPLVSSPGAGTWATLLETADDGESSSPVLLQWLAPDATEPPSHYHPRTESFSAIDGELTVVVDGDIRHIAAGESITVDRGTEHTFRNDTEDTVAFTVDLSSMRTAKGLFSIWGLDHTGAFGSDGEYGEPGLIHALLITEGLRGDTTMTTLPPSVQRVLWATVGPVARALGHRGIESTFFTDEFWERAVEQPQL